MTSRRSLLSHAMACASAPSIVRAESLMKRPATSLCLPPGFGNTAVAVSSSGHLDYDTSWIYTTDGMSLRPADFSLYQEQYMRLHCERLNRPWRVAERVEQFKKMHQRLAASLPVSF